MAHPEEELDQLSTQTKLVIETEIRTITEVSNLYVKKYVFSRIFNTAFFFRMLKYVQVIY